MDESIRRRLEALNREQIPATATKVLRTGTGRGARTKPNAAAPTSRTQLDELLSRAATTTNALGEHLTITVPLAEVWPAGEQLLDSRHEHLSQHPPNESDGQRASFLAAFPNRFLALDLETCGLSGSALFLVGVARRFDAQFVVELLFARTYAEEAAVLASLGERLIGVDTLVTFNGKSFDWPMVNDRWVRYLLHRTTPLPQLVHYDVLHHARRRWQRALPDCKLQTIERMICRRSRTGDIAGHLIPGAYDQYVRTGQAGEMNRVLYHNTVDLVTLLDVAMRLAG